MKTVYWSAIVLVLVLVISIDTKRTKVTIKQAKQEEPTNNILFEKLESEFYNRNVVYDEPPLIRPIAPNVFKMNLTMVTKRIFNEVWLQMVFFYKYNTYQKFPIATKAELCGVLNGTIANPVGQIFLENFLKLEKDLKLSFKLQCPLTGTLSFTAEHFNFSHFTLPLLPAGRYRIDIQAFSTKNGPSLFLAQMYFRISDLRVWF